MALIGKLNVAWMLEQFMRTMIKDYGCNYDNLRKANLIATILFSLMISVNSFFL